MLKKAAEGMYVRVVCGVMWCGVVWCVVCGVWCGVVCHYSCLSTHSHLLLIYYPPYKAREIMAVKLRALKGLKKFQRFVSLSI